MNIISNFDQISSIVTDFKLKGLKIVFTNGCFDILHRGHIEYLEKTKSYGDVLVLGLNSDNSVKRLKGPTRPYVSESDRAFVLSRLESVDVVCVFEEDTPLELLKRVKPDYLVKGGDYLSDQIVGKDFVESYGGSVLTAPFVSGNSSTNIIKKIKEN